MHHESAHDKTFHITFMTSKDSDHPVYPPSIVRVFVLFVCVEVLRPSQPNGVMSSMVSLPNHTFTGKA